MEPEKWQSEKGFLLFYCLEYHNRGKRTIHNHWVCRFFVKSFSAKKFQEFWGKKEKRLPEIGILHYNWIKHQRERKGLLWKRDGSDWK